jgi:DNA-binding transcriptional LysR family regulator
MRLRNLNTFVKVARLGSFHAAAQQLHATQPTISARINALETELGTQLFIRDKSGTRLSSRGVQLLPYAEKLLAISQEMKQQIAEENPQKGTLRIGIADTLAHLWLSPLLKYWQEHHPLVSFELISDVTPTLTKQLEECQLDLALMVANQTLPKELVTEPLASYPQKWVVAPSLLQTKANSEASIDIGSGSGPNSVLNREADSTIDTISGSIKRIEDLAQYPLLSFPRDTRPWHYLQQLFTPLDEMPVFHTCSSVASLLTLTLQGVGIALLPEPIISDALKEGQLIALDTFEQPPALAFCCSWRLDDDRIVPQLLAQSAREIMSPE